MDNENVIWSKRTPSPDTLMRVLVLGDRVVIEIGRVVVCRDDPVEEHTEIRFAYELDPETSYEMSSQLAIAANLADPGVRCGCDQEEPAKDPLVVEIVKCRDCDKMITPVVGGPRDQYRTCPECGCTWNVPPPAEVVPDDLVVPDDRDEADPYYGG